MQSGRKARWQQATALVSLSTCGAVTGFSYAHGTVGDLSSPAGMPVKLLALTKPATSPAASDSALRAAIVRSARHYLSLAQRRPPAAMEALIWQSDSTDGADHGESCAAFASLTLESGARAAGQHSWVTGGATYPWAVRPWVDSRVDPNPESPGVISILQDAEAHHRWHPIGDGYTPRPGDWVLFDGHVEVVTRFAAGVLSTIGGDSMPNLSVNAHQYDGPLAGQGVTGFVNNGLLLSTVSRTAGGAHAQGQADQGQADVPGIMTPALSLGIAAQAGGHEQRSLPDGPAAAEQAVTATAAIPGVLPITGSVTSYSAAAPGQAGSAPRYGRDRVAPGSATAPDTAVQQAFINEVAKGAMAAQRQYGVPAAVTIAQAIDESGWGQSQLAAQYHNLFGIKGTGPAGSVLRPTVEFRNGRQVTVDAPFRVYRSMAQSITDHGLLLATGSSYQRAMADRRSPDAFANDLTGVYATDPDYGASLVTIMRQYNLYRFDAGAAASRGPSPDAEGSGAASIPGLDGDAGIAAATASGTASPGAHLRPDSGHLLRAGPRNLHVSTRRYVPRMPRIVVTDFVATAKVPLLRAKPGYEDVAAARGIRWQLLAACDWMQCQARPGVSPVYGENLGTKNPDGTVYRTKPDALEQCAADLIELAAAVYGINLRQRPLLSVPDLANVFAAFRWGGLLKAHRVSAMAFPYSVQGLSAQHLRMRWPDIGQEAPDKPGTRFRMPFGAVPVVLRLSYPAIA